VAAITLVATVSNYFVPRLPGTHALREILTETVFERSASVDIIRVSDGVTVTVESKQQAWTKPSLPPKYLCVGCQLKSDQAIRSLCLKGHNRAHGSTLWRHGWQEVSEFLCTKTPLFGESLATKNIAKNPRKCSLRRATNVMFSKTWHRKHDNMTSKTWHRREISKFRGWRRKKKPCSARFFETALRAVLINELIH